MSEDVTARKSMYPIVESHELGEAQKRGWLGVLGRSREANEVPRPGEGHHVLVYKVDGRYVLDNVSLGRRDELVVRASHVSVVDMRRNEPIVVEFDIASADSSKFTVVVTFECTVVDPVRVVRDGLTDPHAILLTYIKSHHNTTQMGLNFALADINEVRRYVNAQLTAYRTLSPPLIDGLSIQLTSIEVHTPQELAEFSLARRDRQRRHILDTENLSYDSELQGGQEDVDHELSWARQKHRQDRDFQQHRYNQVVTTEEQEHRDRIDLFAQREDLRRRGELLEFQRHELREANELIGSDPNRALHMAYLAGRLDAGEVADRLHADREQDRTWSQAEADKDRQERQMLEHQRHQEALQKREAHRAERLAELEAHREDTRLEREEAMRVAARKRDIEALDKHWQREDQVEETRARREAEQRRLEAHFQLLRDLAQRGHFDALNLDLERLVTQLNGGAAELSVAGDTPKIGSTEAKSNMDGEPDDKLGDSAAAAEQSQ